nr:RNA-directed DNA polymerase, eukaryota [Tanacetum cinerariifolium]
MGNYRTKEDDVAKISTSIFVTNFPESFSAKDLFHSCKQYIHVVDTFIPNKRSKADKRFGFVRFINLFNDERLVNNLCTIWNDRLKLHANIARFNRAPLKDNNIRENEGIALTSEGFDDINIRYMGELWVMLEFTSCKSKDLFHSNVGAGSWFSVLQKAEYDFTMKGRIVWVEVEDVDDQKELCFHSRRLCIYTKSHSNIFDSFKIAFRGKVYWISAKEVPGWIPEIMEVSDDDEQSVKDVKGGDTTVHEVGNHGEDSDVDEVLEMMFDESSSQKKKQSEDPFGIYPLLDKKRKVNAHGDTVNGESLKYPLGFTPFDAMEMMEQGTENVEKQNEDRDQNNNVEEPLNGRDDCSDNMGTKPDDLDSRCSGRFKKSVAPRTGGSILCLMEEVVKVGQTMGYNMEGCVKDIMNIIESQGASSETKMKSMELITIKSCWGNYAFDYVHSDAVGNSGGVWVKTGAKLLIVVVYAPHDLKDKCLLWDYLTHVSNHWDGDVMMMGDFNEVSNASLEEVPLGGCAYTWCHKSASKMSKLDRFLISENLMHKCPNIYAITLDRFILDHRPIWLRESSFDYGPTPFRFFHYWMEVDGFNEFVIDSWRVAPGDQSNGMRNMRSMETLIMAMDLMRWLVRERRLLIRSSSEQD